MPAYNCGISGVSPKDLDNLREKIEKDMETWWDYLHYKYGCEGSEKAGGNGETIYTDTIKNGGEILATRVTTESSDGNTFTAIYTIGQNEPRIKVTTITDDGYSEVWS